MEHNTAARPGGSSLSEAERREIDAEFAHYETKASVGLEALRIVQKHRGWVSDEALQAVSAYLQIPVAQLEGVATFFQLIFRQPVGREVILLCNSVSCWIKGCEQLQRNIEQRLQIAPGQTTPDGLFTLLETPCLGDCDKAPVMMIGEETYSNLDERSIEKILEDKKHHHADQAPD
ncbi:NADH-quinone oxidoreductase subunit NuoE [Microbulbifer sp. 2201CG32-9]|uniref:NADH-quinone oxidoreductase subunit NuoE n=1 Tax=unclassified Microbulbifer TaxID=2619833 RepID=UPI00345C247B